MTTRGRAFIAVTAIALTLTASAQQATISYADLMRVPAEQRDRQFALLTPENKAAIMTQHLEAWLAVHQPDLSSAQVTVVREAIAFISPDLYTHAPSEQMREQQASLSHRLACALGDDLAATLAQFSRPPQRLQRTWRQSARVWMEWAVNCVV